MGKIGEKFETILSMKKKAFIPFFTAFYPSPKLFREFLMRSDKAGADFIEIGIPFSDPLADGKMIQYSSQWVLEKKFSFTRLLEEVTRLKENISSSLILMSYFNPILQRGTRSLGKELREAGIDGVIVPDLPLEESFSLNEILSSHDIDLIHLVSPASSSRRIREISRHSQGFIYLVSFTGVTGIREALPKNLVAYVNRVRKITSRPLSVGFGISNTFQAKQVAEIADGVIVGSALINLIKGKEKEKNIIKEVENFLLELRKVI